MSPTVRRRILALSIPLVTLACVSLPPEPELYDPPQAATCPPGDRTDWYFDPTAARADAVRWVTHTPADLASACRSAQWAGHTIACAFVFEAGDGRRNIGVVYASVPRWAAPEWLREHEECHTLGWRHGVVRAPSAS